jgi:hypothetical protein
VKGEAKEEVEVDEVNEEGLWKWLRGGEVEIFLR